ncbi:hypothetical protein CEUSTIGMA_g14009.t1 [Chlamydomonas eustigma]|uniref:Peptidase M16 N-terminal domain-containing protein n=1 Tax=Chlamydomonas eustigma TaxID=1157962 RepID=A0A250XU38_9CHLO|nr:hypothetical protein CEUSTIGMA_g14009.t1 [Chlamydomonas eustigma]|eukprot:GAX86601.1 hypothetical protein CEUSTIGMA_g14009.t1 [Chlamydomonas eustigma]
MKLDAFAIQQFTTKQAVRRTACSVSRRNMLLGTSTFSGMMMNQMLSPHLAPAETTQNILLGLENRISEFTLSNGMHFLVYERHGAPLVSCIIHANVGAFDEEEGSTGIAHLLEHMAFKGTSEVGSKQWKLEEPLLKAVDEAFYDVRAAREEMLVSGGMGAFVTNRKLQRLESTFLKLQEDAAKLATPNAYGSILQQAGALGLNATTSQDETRYFVSLPSNKLELWFALEARRFQDPVFRGLYSEKKVVAEERKLRVDTSPLGKYQQNFALAALGNNYRRPVIGFAEDVDRMGRKEVDAFFRKYYGPANLTAAVVGDINPEQVQEVVLSNCH